MRWSFTNYVMQEQLAEARQRDLARRLERARDEAENPPVEAEQSEESE